MKSDKHMEVIARVNSSQDGVVLSPNGISQCCSAGHGNTPKVGLTIKVKEATKQGYANALVGGDRLHQPVHAREQDQKGESG